ncbi:MAG: hypothetical protein ABII02_02525 [Candidatus Magasanikbacteria bacterium]
MRTGRIDSANFEAFLDNPDAGLGQVAQEVYPLTVDYDQSLAQMIEAGSYDWVNSNIIETKFQSQGSGQVEIEVVLVHLNKVVKSEEVLRELDRQGLRAATLQELLALGAAHPELQRQFPILALGSSWRDPDGFRYVPYLGRYGDERDLDLHWFEYGWHEVYRFLAVRQSFHSPVMSGFLFS